MAYAALLSLTHVLRRTLKYDCSYLLPGEEQQIEFLLNKVGYLQDFLDNFLQENIESIEGLERKISDAACQTEDIIESCIADRVLEEYASHSGDIFTTSFNEIAILIEEVDSTKTRAEKIEDESGIQEDLEFNTSLPVSSLRPVSWGQSTMVGLDDALMKIKERLVSNSFQLEIVSIVGMGGIGKTTLAHKVYIDKYIEDHFHIRAWFTVSQEYSVREILLCLLDSMKIQINERGDKDIDQLGLLLYQNLLGRRYLFVMDDVWDIEAWESVKRFFPVNKTRSRIILTTRMESVANYVNPGSPPHHMRFLNDQESWDLFFRNVFGLGFCPLELEKIGCPLEMVKIGKQIAENCRGLPLAVVVIGGLLSKATKTSHYWRSIAENLSSEITSKDEHCSKILSLSYKHLPYHLKGCFLFMGIFPEDFEIKVGVLTKLWVAEGIIKPACSKTLEDVAEEYFLDLVQRSLILVQSKGSMGKIQTYRIHDLLRDLCVREARKEKFFNVIEGSLCGIQGGTSMRRASFHFKKFFHVVATKGTLQDDNKTLSSLVVQSSFPTEEISFDSRPLKVLHMSLEGIHLWLDEMKELVNMRYLYCYDKCPELSIASINKLRNLQTIVSLKDHECIDLPPEIWMMPQLRHVMLKGEVYLPHPPSSEIKGEENSILVLENLQSLSTIHNFSLTEEVVQRIPNLQKLKIHYNYMLESWDGYHINNLVRLAKLESLKCGLEFMYRDFLKSITFPKSLKKLTLDGIELYPDELLIFRSMPNLQVLKLKGCAFDCGVWEPNEREFLELKFLILENIELTHWIADRTHFPRLECLAIWGCDELDEIPSGFGEIQTLQSIKLHYCGYSIVESAKKIKEEQLDWGNDAFKLYIKKY